jgi:four helix bundle protein
MSDYQTLDAWQVARALVPFIYQFTDRFPRHEQYCLTQQMRRAIHSVHLNIAEGNGRLSNGEWQQFLGHARGSLLELESAVVSAHDLKYCTDEQSADAGARIVRAVQLVNGCLRSSMEGFEKKKFKPDGPAPANG